jgi:hypothetical protein
VVRWKRKVVKRQQRFGFVGALTIRLVVGGNVVGAGGLGLETAGERKEVLRAFADIWFCGSRRPA